jgi:hypothetical protein
MFYLLFRAPLSVTWIFILADRAGLLFMVNLPVLYVLAAKTNQPLKFLTGWSYEGLNLFHRRLGEWMIAFAVVHMLGMLVVWWTILRPIGYNFLRYITSDVVFLGIAAILSYFIIYVTSVGWFRRLYYETFLGLHIFFQVAALAFLFFHYPTAKPYVAATFAIWAVDRLVWRITLSSQKFVATLEVSPDEETVLVHCNIDLRTTSRFGFAKLGVHRGWLPGQHVFLTIPSMGFKYRFQAHPFTIASPAPPQKYADRSISSWPLQLVIRSIDGFSLDLLKYARHHQHCQVILDGPHGGMEALEAARHADRVCFVAGGSGIAVTYPLAWDVCVEQGLRATADDVDLFSTRTVYKDGFRTSPVVVDYDSLPTANSAKYAHFWVRQDPRHGKWISIFPRSHGTSTRGPVSKDDDTLEDSSVTNLITQTFDTRKTTLGPQGGRPDMKAEIWNWVMMTTTPSQPSSQSSSSSSSASVSSSIVPPPDDFDSRRPQKEKLCIVVSGPDGLVRDVRNVVALLVRDGWGIEVWVEKFGW